VRLAPGQMLVVMGSQEAGLGKLHPPLDSKRREDYLVAVRVAMGGLASW